MLISFQPFLEWGVPYRYSPSQIWGDKVLLGDFQSRLRKINPGLYVKTDEISKLSLPDLRISGIYLKQHKRQEIKHKNDKNAVDYHHEGYLTALERGELDTFICGVALDYIPEYDVFDFARNQMLMPGWRKIALRLVELKLCSLEKAKKVFECSSLGESDYDKMSFFKRLEWARKLANEVPTNA